jgi:hypothetical protein
MGLHQFAAIQFGAGISQQMVGGINRDHSVLLVKC